jgi:predicted Rossmann fold nucleotide-binding protein DprA/Smf involved in DNA uptake
VRAAFLLARRLARAGVTVVSGGAVGIDSAAHLGALSGKGQTLVVAPTWWDAAYPKSNRRLFEAILRRGGGYLTLSSEGTPPYAPVFFHRNEALIALSHAVVLGECPHKSGAKNAMKFARLLLRPRFALPFRFLDARGRGTWDEVANHGAEMVVDERSVLVMLEEYGPFKNAKWWEHLAREIVEPTEVEPRPEPHDKRRPRKKSSGAAVRKKRSTRSAAPRDERTPDQEAVLRAVEAGSVVADQICERTGLSASKVQQEITLLVLEGSIMEDQGGLLRYHSPPHE